MLGSPNVASSKRRDEGGQDVLSLRRWGAQTFDKVSTSVQQRRTTTPVTAPAMTTDQKTSDIHGTGRRHTPAPLSGCRTSRRKPPQRARIELLKRMSQVRILLGDREIPGESLFRPVGGAFVLSARTRSRMPPVHSGSDRRPARPPPTRTRRTSRRSRAVRRAPSRATPFPSRVPLRDYRAAGRVTS